MSALRPKERERHVRRMREVFGSVDEIREVKDGYAFRLPGSDEMLSEVAEFIRLERRCCPFFRFVVDVAPNVRELGLTLSGPAGVKPFVLGEIGHLLPPRLQAIGGTA